MIWTGLKELRSIKINDIPPSPRRKGDASFHNPKMFLKRFFNRSVFLVFLILCLLISRFFPSVASVQDRFFHSFLKIFSRSDSADLLRQKNTELQIRLNQSEEERASLLRLKSLAEIPPLVGYSLHFARILSYNPLSAYKTFLVNQGSDQGIQKGQGVVVAEGVVGVVVQVNSTDATVLLVTDPSSAVAGEVRPSGARGLLRGEQKQLGMNRNYWMTRMEYLGVFDEVHDQDFVVTSGIDNIFPSGISIGRVQKVIKDSKGLFLSAEVLPEVDFSKLKEVGILISR